MNVESYMREITAAARLVRAQLPRSNNIELHDLVSFGAERICRYGSDDMHPGAAFICAKQGMICEARKWVGRSRHGQQRSFPDPEFTQFDEDRNFWDVWRRSECLDIEWLIDAKRALLGMRLTEAVSWYDHHWRGEELPHLEHELGVGAGRIAQYCASARDKLAQTWRGVAPETECDRAARERARVGARDVRRAQANERMLAERRHRYAELRRLGADMKLAQWGGAAKSRYLVAVRRLTAEGGS